jgi:alkylation response protein AidB-like acyl-CoA dehydrogenase
MGDMNFELSDVQNAIRKSAQEFAAAEFVKSVALEHELERKFPRDLWKKACDLGFISVNYPARYGGRALGLLERTLVTEEFCRRDLGLGIAVMVADFGTRLILKFGSEYQKEKYVPLVAQGRAISGGAFTETEHGSDITRMNTTAAKEDSDWVINGSKMFVSNGCLAAFLIVLCQTDPFATRGYRGMSTIIVETNRSGFEATDIGPKMGLNMQSTARISLNDVRVPLSNLLGIEGRGAQQALEFFNEMRVEIAARALGGAQGAFDRALAYAKQRRQCGQRIVDSQAVQHKLAEMATKIETARLITYKAAWTFDQGRIDPKVSSMAKSFAARSSIEVCDEAIQILGDSGHMLENEVERFYRDVRITDIYEGTREIQKETIARALIGKGE